MYLLESSWAALRGCHIPGCGEWETREDRQRESSVERHFRSSTGKQWGDDAKREIGPLIQAETVSLAAEAFPGALWGLD